MTSSTGLKKNTYYEIKIGFGQLEEELTTKRFISLCNL